LHYRCVAGSQWLSPSAPAALAKRCAGAIAIHSEQQAFMGRGTESVEVRQGVRVRTPSDAYFTPGLLLDVSSGAAASVGAVARLADLNPNFDSAAAWRSGKYKRPIAASVLCTCSTNQSNTYITTSEAKTALVAALHS
jgi:hypothetical protein